MSNLKEQEAKYQEIPIEYLRIDKSYQRPVNTNKINRLKKRYDPCAVGTLIVNQRNIEEQVYYIIDGQHRYAMGKLLKFCTFDCEVIQGLSPEEEAKLFLELNSNRTQIISRDKVKARLSFGDPSLVQLQEMLTKRSLFLETTRYITKERRNKGALIHAIRLEQLMQKEPSILELTLDLIYISWRDEEGIYREDSLKIDIIEGLFYLLNLYKKNMDFKRLTNKLKKTMPSMIIAKRDHNCILHKEKSKTQNLALAILEIYNYKIKNKLNIKI